jgi:hypothetical protein
MQFFIRTEIKTRRDLAQLLDKIDRLWGEISKIKDNRKRGRESLRLKGEIRHLLFDRGAVNECEVKREIE